jgi:signal transduction histidine kinase/CheY-like chemotaxis protein
MNVRDAVLVEQARHIHGNVAAGAGGAFLIACLNAAAFWGAVDARYLMTWLAAGLVVALYRLAAWRAFRRRELTPPVARAWLRHAVIGAALNGTVWGSGALFMFPPGQFGLQLLYVFAVMMLSVSALFSFSVHLPTFFSFFLPSALPATLGLIAQGTAVHVYIAAGIVVFGTVVRRFVRQFNEVFLRAQALRFENEALVGQLTEKVQAVKLAAEAKSRFLAAASHDLRQPMHALNLYLGGLAGLELPAAARATLGNASQCAATMEEMFRALLDISRLDAGAVQPEPRDMPLAPLLERIRLELEPQARAKGVELRVRACQATVRADPAFVERIVRNLMSNAVRYTARGGILVGCRRREGSLRVAVYDTGPGIAAAEQRLVFEEFYQSGNPERDRAKGMGLGLAIVERLAKLMQARVMLASRPGRGSMFAVDLPLAAVASQPRAPLHAAAAGSFAGSLVVVVDDEQAIRDATRDLLEQWRCAVVTAVSARDAVEKLGASPRAPDAIVCDYRLRGGENGLQVVEALRAEFNTDIPALLVTGDTGPERLREIEGSGVRVLHKPLQAHALRAALGGLLSASTAAA